MKAAVVLTKEELFFCIRHRKKKEVGMEEADQAGQGLKHEDREELAPHW